MAPPSQPSREINVDVYTPGGWIAGTIVVPKIQSLLAFVNRPEPFLKLARVTVEATGDRLGFLSLQKSRVLAIVPIDVDDKEVQEFTMATESHHVVALLGGGVVKGEAEVPQKMRLSDYLMKNQGFIPLRQAAANLRKEEEARPHLHRLLLNGAAVIGISEE